MCAKTVNIIPLRQLKKQLGKLAQFFKFGYIEFVSTKIFVKKIYPGVKPIGLAHGGRVVGE